jgi:hypothetical protein
MLPLAKEGESASATKSVLTVSLRSIAGSFRAHTLAEDGARQADPQRAPALTKRRIEV